MKARDWFTAMEKMVSPRMRMGFVLMLIGLLALAVQYAAGATIAKGTVMVSTGSGLVTEFDQIGTNLGQLDTTTGSTYTAGSEFDSAGNFFVTDFSAQQVTKFDPTGALIGSFGSGYDADPESVFFDAAGNVYVGQADGTHNVLKFDPSGTLLNTFSPATENRGTDWVEIAADQCTLFYTSEGVLVKRFNVCTNTQLTDFNTAPLPGANAYAHRLLPSGGILVADTSEVVRLDASGNQIQTYTFSGTSLLFAVNLDPDGTSFWTADLFSGEVFKVDIASGSILQQWSSAGAAGFTAAGGLSVKGEITVGGSITQTLTLTPGPGPNFTNYVFGSYNHKYEYSGANAGDQVTVTAMPSDPEPVNAVLADSNFPTASCIVYDIGKCVVIGVSCLATMGGNDCTTLPYTLRESYNTSQTITGPCLLKTESYPPSPDVWTDIETAFSQTRFDPTNTGRSNGFSYFVVAQNCATVSPASGLNGSNCNGLYTGTYKGNLTVSNGQSCTFTNGGVTGNLTQTGGTVILQSSSFVGGNLQVSGGSLSLSYSTLGKNVQITGGGGFSIGPGVSIGGNLQIQNVPASPGTDQVCGASVKGNLQFQDNGTATQIGAGGGCPGNTVSGDLTVQNNTASTTVDSNTVGGNLTDQNNTALTQIDSNTVKGNLTDQDNTAGSQVFTNVVTKELRCNGDTAISGGGNTAGSKKGQCATF